MNDKIWRNGTWSMAGLARQVELHCATWKQGLEPISVVSDHNADCIWTPPPANHLKCNVDAACFVDGSGFGAVLRDHNGRFVAAIAETDLALSLLVSKYNTGTVFWCSFFIGIIYVLPLIELNFTTVRFDGSGISAVLTAGPWCFVLLWAISLVFEERPLSAKQFPPEFYSVLRISVLAILLPDINLVEELAGDIDPIIGLSTSAEKRWRGPGGLLCARLFAARRTAEPVVSRCLICRHDCVKRLCEKGLRGMLLLDSSIWPDSPALAGHKMRSWWGVRDPSRLLAFAIVSLSSTYELSGWAQVGCRPVFPLDLFIKQDERTLVDERPAA
nr:uncharacterized protein LOC109173080 [Ipomoea batatas]